MIRSLSFDTVIGVGGVSAEPQHFGPLGNSIGGGRTKALFYEDLRAELIMFDYFMLLKDRGPYLNLLAPGLAEHMYEGRVRSPVQCTLV